MNRKRKVIPFSVNRKPKTFYQLKADYIGLLANEDTSPGKKARLDLDFAGNPELMVKKCIKQKLIEAEGYVVANSGLH